MLYRRVGISRSAEVALLIVACLGAPLAVAAASAKPPAPSPKGPEFKDAKAFDVSKSLSELGKSETRPAKSAPRRRGPDPIIVEQDAAGPSAQPPFRASGPSSAATPSITAPLLTFEGLSNQDNFNVFGFRVNRPDPVGDVGPSHYVEMINLVLAVFDKAGNKHRTGRHWHVVDRFRSR